MMKFLFALVLLISVDAYSQSNKSLIDPDEYRRIAKLLKSKTDWKSTDLQSIIKFEQIIRDEFLTHEKPIYDSVLLISLTADFCYSNKFFKDWLYRNLKLIALYSPYLTPKELEAFARKSGEGYYEFGNYKLANEFFKKSLNYREKRFESYLIGRIGRCFIDLGDLDSSIIYYQRALTLSKGDVRWIRNANSLGYTFSLAKRYQEAENYYEKALQVFSERHTSIDSIQYYILQSNVASLDLINGSVEEGVRKLESIANSEMIRRPLNDWFAKEVYGKLVKHYLQIKDCNKLETYLSKLRILFKDASTSRSLILFLESELNAELICNSQEMARVSFVQYEKKRKLYQTVIDEQRMEIAKMHYDIFSEQLSNSQESLDLKNVFEINLKKTNLD